MSSPVRDLLLIRRLSRGRNHGKMTEKPRWTARFAAFAILRCRDLPGSIDRTTDRTRSHVGPRLVPASRRPTDRCAPGFWERSGQLSCARGYSLLRAISGSTRAALRAGT